MFSSVYLFHIITMSRQIYFSFIIVALSFITVKRIQKAGFDHYQFLQTIFQKENGWFNFNRPDFVLNLPFELRNISGMTNQSSDEIACMQDENGIIFIYNVETDSIIRQFNFGSSADLAGLTQVDSSFYLLRKDATLIEFSAPYDSLSVKETKLKIGTIENEAMCFDERNNRLLIAPKKSLGLDTESENFRAIYAIDLKTKALNESPLFVIDIAEIEAFANERNLALPYQLERLSIDSVNSLKFVPSSIAVHPKTDEIYILSSIDHTLAVFDKEGKLISYQKLDSKMLSMPECITFLENGDLIIRNNSYYNAPTLLKFVWQIIED